MNNVEQQSKRRRVIVDSDDETQMDDLNTNN
jgi:hypothetical protein